MPHITRNEDGSSSITVTTHELRALGNLLGRGVPDVKRVLEFVEGPIVRTTLEFVKTIVP